MLKREFYKTREDGIKLYRSYSNENYKIRQIETDLLYDEAIDVEDTEFEYEETNILIDDEIDDSEALEVIIGGE
jgi:hypothetical protein